jgi:uncharacterized membrane protein YfcA
MMGTINAGHGPNSLVATLAASRVGGRGAVIPFLLGTAFGGVAGAVVGSLLSDHVVHLVSGMVGVVDRRSADDEPRFDLLLQ